MITLACHSNKGGVGKTAAAVNLAYSAARDGLRTLLWDLDAQGASSFYLRIKPKIKGGGKALLREDSSLAKGIRETDFENLDLLPADLSYRKLDLILDKLGTPGQTLRERLRPLSEDYDLVVLDCPPGLSRLAEAVMEVSDALLVPVIPSALSINALAQLMQFREHKSLTQALLIPFFSMVDIRRSLHRNLLEHPPASMATGLHSSIPYASDVERMGERRAPVADYAPASRAAQAYAALWKEISGRLL